MLHRFVTVARNSSIVLVPRIIFANSPCAKLNPFFASLLILIHFSQRRKASCLSLDVLLDFDSVLFMDREALFDD